MWSLFRELDSNMITRLETCAYLWSAPVKTRHHELSIGVISLSRMKDFRLLCKSSWQVFWQAYVTKEADQWRPCINIIIIYEYCCK